MKIMRHVKHHLWLVVLLIIGGVLLGSLQLISAARSPAVRIFGESGDMAAFAPVRISGRMIDPLRLEELIHEQSFQFAVNELNVQRRVLPNDLNLMREIVPPRDLSTSGGYYLEPVTREGRFQITRRQEQMEIRDRYANENQVRNVLLPFDLSNKREASASIKGDLPPNGNLLARAGSSLFGMTAPQWTNERRAVLYRLDGWMTDTGAFTDAKTPVSGRILRDLGEPHQQELLGITAANGRPILIRGQRVLADHPAQNSDSVRYNELILEVLDTEGAVLDTHRVAADFYRLHLAREAGKGLDVAVVDDDGINHFLFTVSDPADTKTHGLLQNWSQIRLPRHIYSEQSHLRLDEGVLLLGPNQVWLLAECSVELQRQPYSENVIYPAWWPEDLRMEEPYIAGPLLVQMAFDRSGHEIARRLIDFGVMGDQLAAKLAGQPDSRLRYYDNLSLEEVRQP